MLTASKKLTIENLSMAIADDLPLTIEQIQQSLDNVKDPNEFLPLFKSASQKHNLLLAEYLLAKALASNNNDDKLKCGVALTGLVNANYGLSSEWESFTDKKYQALIESILNFQSLYNKENEHSLNLVLDEGIRCKNINAFVKKIHYLYANSTELIDGRPEARQLCYQLAKLTKDSKTDAGFSEIQARIKQNISDANKTATSDELKFLTCLKKLCVRDFFTVSSDPNQHEQAFNAIIQEYGLTLVSEIVANLDYAPLKFLLAKHHAKLAIENSLSSNANPFIYKKHIDLAEKLFDEIVEKGVLTRYVTNFRDSNPSYSNIMYSLSSSHQLTKEESDHYLVLGATRNHPGCIQALIFDYAESKQSQKAHDYLDLISRSMNWDDLYVLTERILKTPENVMPRNVKVKAADIRRAIKEARKDSTSTYLLPAALDYNKAVNSSGESDLAWGSQPLHFSTGVSAYMVVTKKNPDKIEDEEKPTLDNDAYKLYISFDPSQSENFIQCWNMLLKDVIGEQNIYGIKLFHPKEALEHFDNQGLPKSTGAQPGKMAVVYFHSFENLQKLRGKDYTLEQFRHENFILIKKIEALCQQHNLTPGNNQATPEGGIRAKSADFIDEKAKFVFVSAKEQDDQGKYIPSAARKPNTEEENPYTNNNILAWESDAISKQKLITEGLQSIDQLKAAIEEVKKANKTLFTPTGLKEMQAAIKKFDKIENPTPEDISGLINEIKLIAKQRIDAHVSRGELLHGFYEKVAKLNRNDENQLNGIKTHVSISQLARVSVLKIKPIFGTLPSSGETAFIEIEQLMKKNISSETKLLDMKKILEDHIGQMPDNDNDCKELYQALINYADQVLKGDEPDMKSIDSALTKLKLLEPVKQPLNDKSKTHTHDDSHKHFHSTKAR